MSIKNVTSEHTLSNNDRKNIKTPKNFSGYLPFRSFCFSSSVWPFCLCSKTTKEWNERRQRIGVVFESYGNNRALVQISNREYAWCVCYSEFMNKKHSRANTVIITKCAGIVRESQQSLEFYIKRFFAYVYRFGYRSTFGPVMPCCSCTTSTSLFSLLLAPHLKCRLFIVVLFSYMWILLLTFHVTMRCTIVFLSLCLTPHCALCAMYVVSSLPYFLLLFVSVGIEIKTDGHPDDADW